MPLITHTQRLYYDSGDTAHNTGNLDPSSNKHGVRWDNLKYAIRVHNIIEAIQTKYGLTFSSDFLQKQATINTLSCLCGYTEKKV